MKLDLRDETHVTHHTHRNDRVKLSWGCFSSTGGSDSPEQKQGSQCRLLLTGFTGYEAMDGVYLIIAPDCSYHSVQKAKVWDQSGSQGWHFSFLTHQTRRIDIETFTVDEYQGSQADVVLFSTATSTVCFISGFNPITAPSLDHRPSSETRAASVSLRLERGRPSCSSAGSKGWGSVESCFQDYKLGWELLQPHRSGPKSFSHAILSNCPSSKRGYWFIWSQKWLIL